MSEIFKIDTVATAVKKHFVDIDGKQHEVSLEKKLEVLKHGEENFVLKDGKIVLRPPLKRKTVYPVLKEVDRGYVFEQNDIHWPSGTAEGGMAWLIEQE
jgi:hypothetical protein